MTNKLEIDNSDIEDIVLGNKNIYPAELLPLEKAIKSIQDSIEDTPELEGIIEELAEYTTNRPDREIIGVEQKLKNGGRDDLIDNALFLKNKFERRLAKKQLSKVEQHVYAHILASIESAFNHYVRPLILNGSEKVLVDAAVHQNILEPVYKSVVGFDPTITVRDVSGMLYFLTGKCHLIWSE